MKCLTISQQQITCIEAVHLTGIVHRDIKPDHFLLQCGSKQTNIQLVDFGLAKSFRHPQTLQHIPYSSTVPFVGTARYCSVNAHAGAEQSRRDDLESLAYLLIYLQRGSFPWQGLLAKSKCLQKKQQMSVEQLCSGLPPAFQLFLDYVRALKFDKDPDYGYLRQLFVDVRTQQGYEDTVFDWDICTSHRIDAALPNTPPPPTKPLPVHPHADIEAPDVGCRM